ncbi:MAG: DegT/DnrJ/EryC1/StrS aminotransferase family protein [Xanthomonadaceae bacterium]|nr:DegT/DnrJ/EryC1/StrS aminotransferase family protein [Xanthomonadaceae bacterium]
MIPRKKLDIDWTDLAFALFRSLPGGARRSAERLEASWSPGGMALATASVRSGFDLVLQQLALPAGSEVLVSAVTIRDMVAIIERHGLRPVPVDIDPSTCAPDIDALEAAITPNSRVLLVAHLFGARVPMEGIAATAKRCGLFLFEDCAQAFSADGYRGNPLSDVTMFSFGPIKTATSLGGGILLFRDRARCADARQRQTAYPRQGRVWYVRRLLKYALIKAMIYRFPYTMFTHLCGRLGKSHDRVLSASVRSFVDGDLLPQLRRQPAHALLALMDRRLRLYDASKLFRRIEAAVAASNSLGAGSIPGILAQPHCHWVLPFQCPDPDALMAHLFRHGFDATRGAASLYAVQDAMGNAPTAAERMMAEMVYLPAETASPAELGVLLRALHTFTREMDLARSVGSSGAP